MEVSWFVRPHHDTLLIGLKFLLVDCSVLASAYFGGPKGLLSSALEDLTAEFGMGSGVTPPLETPGQNNQPIRN